VFLAVGADTGLRELIAVDGADRFAVDLHVDVRAPTGDFNGVPLGRQVVRGE
jgi:hypothetical protein